MKKHLPLLVAGGLFLCLVAGSAQAAEGARAGISLCAATLIPSLFPFFTLANLLSELGLPDLLGQRLTPLTKRLFRVSGCGAQAFVLGISGGYPLGASVVADLRKRQLISRAEGERLLAFCNNSGPAFILGAAGGVFHSPGAGLLLYGAHILGAVLTGILFRGHGTWDAPPPAKTPPQPLSAAFPRAVSKALTVTLSVCAYVTFFQAFMALIPVPEALSPAGKALFTGVWELAGGIASFRGLAPTPVNLALAAFLLGWGGISVHLQTIGVLADTDIKSARHLAGRALCGIFAAVFTFLLGSLLF